MYRLLGFPTQNSKKVIYTLEELGVDYEYQLVDLFKRENKQESFQKLNPFGKTPVLKHDNESIFESGAICRYLANVEQSPLYPNNKLQRAKVDQWMDFFSCHLGRWLSTLLFEKIIKAKAGIGDADESACDEAVSFANQQFPIVDKWLESHKYFIGDSLTIADIFAFAYIELTTLYDLPIDSYTHIKQWFDNIDKREGIQRGRQKIG